MSALVGPGDSGQGKQLTCVTSAARTTNPSDVTIRNNTFCKGIKVVINVTAQSGGSVTCTIQGHDILSGATWTLLASAAITTVSTVILTVYPGAPVSANVSANDVIPAEVILHFTSANGSSITYSVTAELVP